MSIYTFFEYFLAFMLYSFLGWCVEVLLTFSRSKRFVDRGFLLGPYCPIYGFGGIFIVSLLNKYMDSPLVLFILAMVISLVLEYLTSYFMELIFKARWWDYSSKKFNINGRVCLEYAVPFGLGGVIIMYLVHPLFMGLLVKLEGVALIIVGTIILSLFLVDNIVSFVAMSKIHGFEFKKYKDSTEDITNMVKEYLMKHSRLTKRLIKAFPNVSMKIKEYREQLKK